MNRVTAATRFATAHFGNAGGRAVDQDYADYRILDGHAIWVVADGLGGHRGGEVASKLAVEAVLASFDREPSASGDALKRYVELANQAVLDAQASGHGPESMRTTIVVVAAKANKARWAHVGDSRAYHFRAGVLSAVTRDHSVPQMLVDMGEIEANAIREHEDRSRLTRALGQEDEIEVAVSKPANLAAGDALLLCTDGWWDWVSETDMEVDLAKSATPDHWLAWMVGRLQLVATGDYDNYTALAVLVGD